MAAPRLAHVWSSDFALRAALPFCEPLLARGWDITHLSPPGPHAAAVAAAGMRWRAHQLGRGRDLGRDTWADVRGAADLCAAFAKGRFDIVHTHHAPAGLLGRVAAAAVRVPIVVHSLGGLGSAQDATSGQRALGAGIERLAGLRTKVVFTQSTEDRAALLK